MTFKSDGEVYGKGTRALHWLTAIIIIALIGCGYLLDDLKFLTPTHKAIGILALTLGLLRLVWWLFDGPRPGLEGKAYEVLLAKAVKLGLLLVGLAMPLSGWLMSSAADKPISFFGLFTVPPLVAPDKEMAHFFKGWHENIAVLLILLLALHVVGALRHHFLLKDNVLRRMLPCVGGDCNCSCGHKKKAIRKANASS